VRLTVVGGGSTYTPELVDGLGRLAGELPIDELVLLDPDEERLAVVGAFAERMLRQAGSRTSLVTTTDREAAIDGASAVLLQFRVGGQQARAQDEAFPLECGCVGQETTGAGGLAKAMRTVPVALDLARVVSQRAARDAWIVDFTNPVGIVTRALLDDGHRAVGLCNVAIGFQRLLAGWLGTAPAAVELDHVGLNHLTWIRAVHVGGVDVLPRVIDEHGPDLAGRLELPLELIRELRMIPSYYLRYYYAHDEVVAELLREGTRAAEVQLIEADLLELYRDPALVTKPPLLDERGGAYYSEAAVALLASLLGRSPGQRHVANVRNAGTLGFLPADAVIETSCDVTSDGARPLPVRPMDPLLAGLVAHVSAYEELALDAALHGGRERVVSALLAHPLVGQWDIANRLSDELIARNREYLPWT
jgi:6-phospho-beta-glucosidase